MVAAKTNWKHKVTPDWGNGWLNDGMKQGVIFDVEEQVKRIRIIGVSDDII